MRGLTFASLAVVAFASGINASSSYLSNRLIVELHESDVSSSPGPSPPTNNVHASFYSALQDHVGDFRLEHEYNTSQVFVGASISTSSTQDLAQVAQLPGVKTVRRVPMINRPQAVGMQTVPSPHGISVPQDSESTHIMTGVDKLHARGVYGKGIKIGIVDTGIDYTHPSLGGGFGPGNKVEGGFDLVGDAYNGANAPMPDQDPLDQCFGHGTHVAGIIGADPNNAFNISGVAPESTIYAYRVFGCEGGVSADIIIAALLRAHQDGVDVINMSIGGSGGWTEDMIGVVSSRLADQGIVVVVSASNSGQTGSWFSSDISNGIEVISVASVDNTVVPTQNATTSDPDHETIPYIALLPLPISGSLPIYATSNDTTVVDDACNPLPPSTPDLSRFLVIIRRGTCGSPQKLQNIQDKGAKASLIYDDGSGFVVAETGNFTTAIISETDGQYLVSQFKAGTNFTVAFPQGRNFFNFPSSSAGLVSFFSSYGPTNDMYFKPAVASPGGNILSTFPVNLGNFSVESGTSMASPFMAGSCALYLQVKGKNADVARSARTRFETTAQGIPSNHSQGAPLQTLTQAGAGLINVYNAIYFDTVVTPGELLLNDTAHLNGSHTITVQNTGPNVQKYKVTHVPAGTAITFTPMAGTDFPATGPVPLTTNHATVQFSATVLTIPSREKATFCVTITPPAGVGPEKVLVYSGFIQIQCLTSGENVHVSYLGTAAVLKNLKVLDTTGIFNNGTALPAVLDSQGNVQSTATNYTFVGEDFPSLRVRLLMGTAKLTVDLVNPSLEITKRDAELLLDRTPYGQGVGFDDIPVVGRLFELDYVPRNSNGPDEASGRYYTLPSPTPMFTNNLTIPNGQYKMLLRALRITGDPKNEADYDQFLSGILGVNVAAN